MREALARHEKKQVEFSKMLNEKLSHEHDDGKIKVE
jgi:hypothetical protein